jgi:hypothetical protein
MSEFNSYIGKQYKKPREYFSLRKFIMGFFGFTPVAWAKDFISILNVRKLIIYAIIIGSIFGYGWWHGKINQPLKIDIGDYQSAQIKLHNGYVLFIEKDGTATIRDEKGNIIKQLKNKDLDVLKEKLKPYGFELSPIAVGGVSGGTSGDISGEMGVGLRWFRAWKINVESFLTNKGVYPLGLSYKLDGIGLDNTSVGIGVGTSYERFMEDKRIIAYFSIKF